MSLQQFILSNRNFKNSRLESLYSDFCHLHESNIEGYRANIAAWKTLLLDLIENHNDLLDQDDRVCLCGKILIQQLTVNDGTLTYKPRGLDKVIDSMVNDDHTLIPYSEFDKKPVDVTGNGDGLLRSIVSSFFGSGYCNYTSDFRSGTGSLDGSLKSSEKYISPKRLRKMSKEVKELFKGQKNAYRLEHLYDLCKNKLNQSRFDFDCCIKFLSRDTEEIKVDGDVISILRTDESEELDFKNLEAIANLNYAIYTIQKYCSTKLTEVCDIDAKIRELVKQKQHNMAKSQLRLKKAMEKQLNTSQAKLEKLQMVQMMIEEAHNNIVTLKTLESNSSLLKKLNRQVGKDTELDELLNEYGSAIDETNTISEKLGGVNDEGDDIEEELKTMEKQEKEKEKEKEKEDIKPLQSVSDLEERFKNLKLPKEKSLTDLEEDFQSEKPKAEPLLEA
ncbi:hypothetical protein FOA43_000563 [Brettanomyces nanus]|uniref:Vacuolar-sorting protein SNF7 n=1 Tax=Eeniella nana TaxID=13502 RepID=A0A875RYX5_EENNA|nr:uncharacterized protein FOA43_000563 [Brettanomyces nanus]QPG73255.1 hypothetical protein FOA43_000563 [Brettanomyces nanus]